MSIATIIAAALCAMAYSLGHATGERRGRAPKEVLP